MRIKLLAALAFCQPVIVTAALPAVDATIPIEVLAVDPALASGAIPRERTWSSPRIAMQPARAAGGAILEGKRGVLLLALVVPVEKTAGGTARLDGPPDRIAWCEQPNFMTLHLSCYRDLDADGKFETVRNGIFGADDVLALSRLQEPRSIEPLAYRAAETGELPLYQVGYRQCGTTANKPQTLDGELRFETVVRRAEGVQWPKSGRCDSLATPLETRPDGSRLFQVGKFKVEVRDEQPAEFATRLVEGIPAGTLLAHVRTSWPLLEATERPADSASISGQTPYLVAVGAPKIAAQANSGDEVFSVEVRHGLAGRLSVDSDPGPRDDGIRLPAGTPVYGVTMGSSLRPLLDAEIVWCTPVQLLGKPLQPYCFVPSLSGVVMSRAYSEPYSVTAVTSSGKFRNPPLVERSTADFGAPLDLVVKVMGADRKNVRIGWSLAPRGQSFQTEWRIRRARDDAAFVLLGEMLLKIKPAADGKSFEVSSIGGIAPGDAVYLPRDASRLR